MKKLSKKQVSCLIIFLFVTFTINILYIRYLENSPLSYRSESIPMQREEYRFADILLTADDYVQQNFKPTHQYLKSVQLRLAVNHGNLKDEFILCIRLMQGDSVVIERLVSSREIENWHYYTLEIGENLDTNKEYSVVISQIKGPYEENSDRYWISYVPFLSPVHVAENSEYYIRNGVECEGEFEIEYIYEEIDHKEIILLCFINLLLILFAICCIWGNIRYERVYNFVFKMVGVFFPFFCFCGAEFITGNLQTIDISYWVKNLLIYYFMFSLVMLLPNTKFAIVIYTVFIYVVALVYYYVLLFRGQPFVLGDILSIETAATVASTYSYELTKEIILVIGISAVLLSGFVLCKKIRLSFRFRIFSFVVFLIGVCMCSKKGVFTTNITFWDMNEDYTRKGLFYTLVAEIPHYVNEKPQNYSLDYVEDITRNIEHEEISENIPENIIVIMNESFADFSCYGELSTEDEILPFWNSIGENTQRGWLLVPTFGGGTANSEYEVLTGNSMRFHTNGNVPYQSCVHKKMDSLVSALKTESFYSIAIHPYPAINWNRENVYAFMGFDEFISLENWGGEQNVLRWCETDYGCYQKIIEQTENVEQNTFIFCVTLQNHGGYAGEWDNFSNSVTLNYETNYPYAEQYLSLLQQSDNAIEFLLDYYRDCNEDTLIVIFGDHQPAVENGFYEELLGKSLGELSTEEMQTRYITPFLIWANYDIEEKENMFISSNYLGIYALSVANVRQSAYNQFLLNLMEQIPVIGIGGVYDESGKWYATTEMPEDIGTALNQYEILQYNNIFDDKNRINKIFDAE